MSSSREKAAARVPQRERGKRRVAALLEAAVSLFAEKGYDAVTMTEIAARAGAPIGSLYQFFPGKETLADALIERFGEHLNQALSAIEDRLTTMPIAELVDALLGLMVGFREERAAAAALIEARQEASNRAAALRLSLRRHVARILTAKIPTLSEPRAERMAWVVIQLMKAATVQSTDKERAGPDGTLDELKALLHLYLSDRIACPQDQ